MDGQRRPVSRNPNNSVHLASVDFSPIDFVTDEHRRRANAILLRRTDRLPFAEAPHWDAVESQLRRTVTSDAVRLDVIADDLRPELAHASQLTESLRLYDSSYHSEMLWWTGPFEVTEGIPHSSLVSATESERVDIGRIFPVTSHSDLRPALGHDHPRSSCCPRLMTTAPVCCGVAKCFPRYCLKPQWRGWPPAR